MAEENAAKLEPVVKGYARLKPAWRRRAADVMCVLAGLCALLALFMPTHLEGVWLRFPVLVLIPLLAGASWYVNLGRKGVSPIARGGVVVALMGCALLAMALHRVSGFTSLAGLLALGAAFAVRGASEKALVKGREIRPKDPTFIDKIFDNIESLAAALVVVLLVWHFALEAFQIPSGSMAPTLIGSSIGRGSLTDGDRVVVDKFTYQWRDPRRWEPVVFRYPLRRTDPYVKRCVALPGEQVLIAQGDLYVKEHETASINLLRKEGEARETLWLPIVRKLDGNSDWVMYFHREGAAAFADGVITLKQDGQAVFPRGKGAEPTDVVDHDASFGKVETPKEFYGRRVVGDIRLRADVELASDGKLAVQLTRDGDVYLLTLGPGRGGATLAHSDETGNIRALADGALSKLEVPGEFELEFSLADGLLSVKLDGEPVAEVDVGSPLLDQLRARDKQKRMALDSEEAIRLAMTTPPGGRKARLALKGIGPGCSVKVLGIDRDVYYVGRTMLDGPADLDEYPFAVRLDGDRYLVLGDNSPGSADCRFWTRVTLFFKDSEVSGALDHASQPALMEILARAINEGDTYSASQMLYRVAHFTPAERGDTEGADARDVAKALELLKEHARRQGRAAIDFYTEGGGYVRINLADIEHLQVERMPYVERELFVGRPFAVFLSPRGLKLID